MKPLITLFHILSFLVHSILAQDASPSTDAPITENNPDRATFQAVLQQDKPVQGQITGVSNDNGTGVNFNVNFFNFPDDDDAGPFKYHIHTLPVPPDGNCSGTAGHLSPFGREDTPPCAAAEPSTCQPGDLSGKHGAIDGKGTFQTFYLDLYVSTDPLNVAFFGNRSVVIHAANGTRLNCGNFTQQVLSSTATGGIGGPTSNSSTGGSGSNNNNGNESSTATSGSGSFSTGSAGSMSTAGAQGGFTGLKAQVGLAAGAVAVIFALL